MTLSEAIDRAGEIAGIEEEGWNQRYRDALATLGVDIIGPEDYMFAPHCAHVPFPGDSAGWSRHAILVKRIR